MAIVVEDIGALSYGGLVTAANWWDEQRVARGELASSDILKKLGTWAYLIPGGGATIMSAFGVWRQQESWLEKVQTGFIYDFPRFLRSVVTSMQGNGGTAASAAVREANRIMKSRTSSTRQLAAGRVTDRSYQQEFQSVAPHAF